jgi:hypothetical protein
MGAWPVGEARAAATADSDDWNFDGAFSAASGVIPTLVLALVLQNELLPVAASFATHFRKQMEQPPRLVKFLMRIYPTYGTSLQVSAVLARPSSIVLLAILAELFALFWVAAPAGWRDEDPGRIAAFVSLGFIGFVVFLLLMTLAMGLLAAAAAAERQADVEAGDGTPDETA